MNFTDLDAALTTAEVPADQLPMYRALFILVNALKWGDLGGVQPFSAEMFVAHLSKSGVFANEA
jgi:hypothetical protein